MNHSKRIVKSFVFSVLAAGLVLSTGDAHAGRGASLSSIDSAIRSGGADAIISELERAERLVCAGCIEKVMPLLDSEDYRVREAAAWWFARRPAQKAELTERSLAYLQTGDSVQARNAADIVGTFRHPKVIPALTTALGRSDLDAGARLAIVRAMGTIGHASAAPAVESAMHDSSADVRLAALSAFKHLRAVSHADGAVQLLGDSDIRVRRQATALVGYYRMADARTQLEAQLKDPDPGVRRNAAWALGRIGSVESRDALMAATEDESGLVRRVARVALGQLGTN